MLHQVVSVVGALLILAAYALSQAGRLRPSDVSYAVLNFVGAGLLTWVAVVDRRAGFILLEGSWALLSLLPLAWSRRPGVDGSGVGAAGAPAP